MKMTLEFHKLSEIEPKKGEKILVAYNVVSQKDHWGAAAMPSSYSINMDNKHMLYWSYFNFQPERLSEETSKEDAIV